MSTEDNKPNTAALAQALSLAFDLKEAGAGYAGEAVSTFSYPEEMRQARLIHLEKHRGSVRAELQAQLAALTGEGRRKAEDRLADIETADSIGRINSIAHELRREIAQLMGEASMGMAAEIDEARQAMQAINAMHHRLYEHDPLYRRQMDAISSEANASRTEADARDERLTALLQRHGISTSVDDELEAEKRKRAEAVARGNLQEVGAIDVKIDRLRLRQLEEVRNQAEAHGNTEVLAAVAAEQPQRQREASASLRRFDSAARAYLDACRRALKAQGLDAQEIEERLKEEHADIRKTRASALGRDDRLSEDADHLIHRTKAAERMARDREKQGANDTKSLPRLEVTDVSETGSAPAFTSAAPNGDKVIVKL